MKPKTQKILLLIADISGVIALGMFIAMILFIINGCTPQPVLHGNPIELQEQMEQFSKKWNMENKERYESCRTSHGLPVLDYETGKWECLRNLNK